MLMSTAPSILAPWLYSSDHPGSQVVRQVSPSTADIVVDVLSPAMTSQSDGGSRNSFAVVQYVDIHP
jgi:hypothetical protein